MENKIDNLKGTKKMWKWMQKISFITFCFWIFETVFFLIVEGLHIKANSQAEKVCDSIVGYTFNIMLIFFIVILVNVVESFLSSKEDEQ
jgi:hypothetical protein